MPSLSGSGAGASGSSGVDHYIPRFLLWLWGRTDPRTGEPVPCTEFGYQQVVPDSLVRAVVDGLQRQRMVRVHGDVTGTDLLVSLEPAGVEQVQRLQRLRANDVERYRYARRALLAWILARADRSPLHVQDFFDSPEVFFLGQALAPGEVAQTVEYLHQQGLVTCEGHLFEGRVGSHLTLTELGMDAVLSEYDIDRFLARRREQERPVTQYVFERVGFVNTGTMHGNQVVNVDQNISSEESSRLVGEIAQLVRQLTPVLTPGDESRRVQLQSELLAAAEDLQTGETQADDTRRREGRRGGLERVQRALQASPETMGRQLMLQMVGAALGALGGAGLA